MPVFQKNKFPSKGHANTFAARYRAAMAKHPFALFGLPFLAVIIGGSFVLTPATAIRYERHDRKVRQMTREEELNVGKGGRKVDIREEYYVSLLLPVADEQCFEIPTSNDFVSETRGQGPGQLGAETGEAAQGRNRWNLVIVSRLGNDWAESGHTGVIRDEATSPLLSGETRCHRRRRGRLRGGVTMPHRDRTGRSTDW